ncbi:hypothetical protein KUTeg_017501 [Tegillarca granosa]|uniref:Guanylate cyclase n=1 Tax=Tegillarca granosa TaxID=220873 RepID=A0ABQ9EF35_TEGGR|nr:hypothetical protein KUTeg_017501 [Tegillarca granosa]
MLYLVKLRLLQQRFSHVFAGITGNVHVDSNGDRDPDYWIWDLKPSGEKFEVVMHARMTSQSDKKIHFLRPIVWDTSNGLPPFDTPVCGFNNELCYSSSLSMLAYSAVAVVLILFAIVGSMVAVLFYSIGEYNTKTSSLRSPKAIGSISQLTICSTNSILMQYSVKESVTDSRFRNQIFSTIGSYQNRLVTIRTLAKGKLTLKRDDYLELKTMYDLHHDNINIFIGLCDDERKPCLLMTYCTKGSLQISESGEIEVSGANYRIPRNDFGIDILENDDVKLDWMFKMSLIADLVNFCSRNTSCSKNLEPNLEFPLHLPLLDLSGMDYLHKSPIRLHGNLKSSNCVVDNRWVLKLTDFGLLRLRYMYLNTLHEDSQKCRGLLWTAPEHIPDSLIYPTCSRKGDVYSFGIILYEILHRLYPYNTNIFSPEDVIQRVKSSETPPFRPPSSYGNEVITGTEPEQLNKILSIMENCWAECPDARPTFVVLKRQIAALTVGRQTNIVDNMIVMLEKYSNNLEELVEQRTTELVEEKKKTDALLYSLLPASVAEKLKKGVMVDPEIFSSVTIFFSDIVGFTSLCSTSTAIEIVDFLNDLYTEFDSIIAHHDVYKASVVETIGDAYMVVSGLPVQNKDRHAVEIANMALNLQRSIYTFQIKHRPGMQLRLRIGIHTGPCAAGVVGRIMPRYCLFGDTVNIASRMESTGEGYFLFIYISIYLHLCVNYKLFIKTLRKKTNMHLYKNSSKIVITNTIYTFNYK